MSFEEEMNVALRNEPWTGAELTDKTEELEVSETTEEGF